MLSQDSENNIFFRHNSLNYASYQSEIEIKFMSTEVVTSNPYAGLIALERVGIVENYEITSIQ